MINNITMNLTKEELKGILTEYLKKENSEDINVDVKFIKTRDYRDECDMIVLSVSYTKPEMIMNHKVAITVTLGEDEVKSILSKMMGKYEVSYMYVQNSSVKLTLREKQKVLERKCGGYDFR